MIQFYTPGLPVDLEMPESEASHCLRVLRMGQGDPLVCVDGSGHRYRCRIDHCTSRRATLVVEGVEIVPRTWPADIIVAVAPTKHLDRMEWLVEKLVEIGVDRIIPIRSERSERKELKIERLEKIAVSAMKQSLKATIPYIHPMIKLEDLMKEYGPGCGIDRYIAYCDPSLPRHLFTSELHPGVPMMILIGPEGDFSPVEIEEAIHDGFTPVSLGDQRLRTETAALYAVMAAHAIGERDPKYIK